MAYCVVEREEIIDGRQDKAQGCEEQGSLRGVLMHDALMLSCMKPHTSFGEHPDPKPILHFVVSAPLGILSESWESQTEDRESCPNVLRMSFNLCLSSALDPCKAL